VAVAAARKVVNALALEQVTFDDSNIWQICNIPSARFADNDVLKASAVTSTPPRGFLGGSRWAILLGTESPQTLMIYAEKFTLPVGGSFQAFVYYKRMKRAPSTIGPTMLTVSGPNAKKVEIEFPSVTAPAQNDGKH
jgi:hypothetical protein